MFYHVNVFMDPGAMNSYVASVADSTESYVNSVLTSVVESTVNASLKTVGSVASVLGSITIDSTVIPVISVDSIVYFIVDSAINSQTLMEF